jgi:hypothetical protein
MVTWPGRITHKRSPTHLELIELTLPVQWAVVRKSTAPTWPTEHLRPGFLTEPALGVYQ